VGLERGPLSLVSTIEDLLGRKSRGPCLESQDYGRRDPQRWPRGTLCPQKLQLTSPTSRGHSVGILRSQTKATELLLLSPQPSSSSTLTESLNNHLNWKSTNSKLNSHKMLSLHLYLCWCKLGMKTPSCGNYTHGRQVPSGTGHSYDCLVLKHEPSSRGHGVSRSANGELQLLQVFRSAHWKLSCLSVGLSSPIYNSGSTMLYYLTLMSINNAASTGRDSSIIMAWYIITC
jgi:hypothetical protein